MSGALVRHGARLLAADNVAGWGGAGGRPTARGGAD